MDGGGDFMINCVNDNSIRFSSGASEKMRILNDGNVGIGTTAPTHNLHVNGTVKVTGTQTFDVASGGGSYISINHTGNESWTWGAQSGSGSDDYLDVGISGGTRAMSWHEDGKVGIGTTTPNADVNIIGKMGSVTSDWKTALNIGTTEEPTYSVASISVKNEGKEMMLGSNLHFAGESGLNTKPDASKGSSAIVMYTNASTSTTTGTTIIGGHYAITDGASSSLVSHVTVIGDGKVGIGTSTPTAKLEVKSSGGDTFFANFMPSTGSGYAKFYQSSNNHPSLYMASSTGTASIVLNSSGVSYLTSGNLIIGGSADNGKLLQVQGTGYFSGDVMIGTTSSNAKLTIRADSGYAFRTENASGNTFRVEASSGNVYPSGSIYIIDNEKLRFGNSNDDLLIYHDASHNFIDASTGTLYLRNTASGGSGIILRNSTIGDIQFDNEFAGNILFNTSNIERMRIDSSGNVGINTTSPTEKLAVDGNIELTTNAGMIGMNVGDTWGTSNEYCHYGLGKKAGSNPMMLSSYFGLLFGTQGNERLEIAQNGKINCGAATISNTTSSSANMYMDALSGEIKRSTSSRRYKTNIVDYTKGLSEVIQLQPKTYNDINGDSKQFAGLIAEDVHDLGLTEYVYYNENNEPDALGYSHMIALLTNAIKELKQENDNLKARVSALES